jgi:hypothetical protein
MSKFIDLYREKKRIEAQLRKIRLKTDPDTYWKLKDKAIELNNQLNEIIKKEKANDNDSRT